MTKIMLVEDDNNLREIYEARLLAEGYEIVSAKDGEEALAMAVKEKPDLIISDVMMPKISGFDMLDILRSTPETKNTKVIMMTALSQAEDKARADKLGADKYLVKSQVTLEDVARVAAEVISGETTPTPTSGAAAPAPVSPSPIDPVNPITPASPAPVQAAVAPITPDPTPASTPVAAAPAEPPTAIPVTLTDSSSNQIAQSSTSELDEVQKQIAEFESIPAPVQPEPTPAPAPTPIPTDESAALDTVDTSGNQVELPSSGGIENIGVAVAPPLEVAEEKKEGEGSSKRIIQPINDLSEPKQNLADLAAKEEALEAATQNPAPTANQPVSLGAPAADTVITPTSSETPAS